MEIIKTVGLTKKYKDITAVNSLDLSINEGELFALLGVNGAGKTTTIKMLTCLTSASGGDAFISGSSIISNADEIKRVIAVSPQETAVAPNLSVRENLQLVCGIFGFDKAKTEEKISTLGKRLGLESVLNKKA